MNRSKFCLWALTALALLCFLAPLAFAADGPTNYPGSGAPWNSPSPGQGDDLNGPPGWAEGDTDLILLGVVFHI